jgi:hypothetical protein
MRRPDVPVAAAVRRDCVLPFLDDVMLLRQRHENGRSVLRDGVEFGFAGTAKLGNAEEERSSHEQANVTSGNESSARFGSCPGRQGAPGTVRSEACAGIYGDRLNGGENLPVRGQLPNPSDLTTLAGRSYDKVLRKNSTTVVLLAGISLMPLGQFAYFGCDSL